MRTLTKSQVVTISGNMQRIVLGQRRYRTVANDDWDNTKKDAFEKDRALFVTKSIDAFHRSSETLHTCDLHSSESELSEEIPSISWLGTNEPKQTSRCDTAGEERPLRRRHNKNSRQPLQASSSRAQQLKIDEKRQDELVDERPNQATFFSLDDEDFDAPARNSSGRKKSPHEKRHVPSTIQLSSTSSDATTPSTRRGPQSGGGNSSSFERTTRSPLIYDENDDWDDEQFRSTKKKTKKKKRIDSSRPPETITPKKKSPSVPVPTTPEEKQRARLQVVLGDLGRLPKTLQVADSLIELGNAHLKCSEYSDALKLFKDAVRIRRRLLGDTDPAIGRALDRVGLACAKTGDYKWAMAALQEALQIRFDALGPWNVDVADTLNNIAGVHLKKNELHEARQAYEEVLSVRKAIFGKDHPSVAITLYTLGNVCMRCNDFDASYVAYDETLRIYRYGLKLKESHKLIMRVKRDIASTERLQVSIGYR